MEVFMKEKYFAASNSYKGFCSYYPSIFDIKKYARIYVIKGGSGTGKSYFMKQVGTRAENVGYSVRYIYCSSDSSSLDGIIINEMNIAIIDGTSPHIYEPKFTGVAETIIDLGQFLDEGILVKSRKKIEEIYSEKLKRFAMAYNLLASYGKISENIDGLVYPAIKMAKMRKFIGRFVDEIEMGKGEEEHFLSRSIGMNGLTSFNTYFENAKIYYAIDDYFDTAHILLGELHSFLCKKRVDIMLSNNPIMSEKIDALQIKNNNLTFEITNEIPKGARIINMKRFIDSDYVARNKREYNSLIKARNSILNLALDEFERIKKCHFELENIYGLAMNFDKKEQFCNEFCNKILQRN